MIQTALTLAQKRALRNKPGKRGREATKAPALQGLKPGASVDFPLDGTGYANLQSARSSRSDIERLARSLGIPGEAFDWTEPATEDSPERHVVTFVRAE